MTWVTARGFKRRWYKLLALTCLSGRRPIKFVVLDCQQESNPSLSPREQQLIQQTAAHNNNCSCTFPSTSTLLQSVWTSGCFLDRGLLLGLCWTKHSPRANKKERKMSDECLERKEAQQQPPWRPREGPKLPSTPLWAKPLLNLLPSNLPCRFPQHWMCIRASPWLSKRHTRKQMKEQLRKGYFLSLSHSRWFCPLVPSNPLSSVTQHHLLFPPSWPHLPSDIESLCLSWKVSVLFDKWPESPKCWIL